jgi:hypothetical protein
LKDTPSRAEARQKKKESKLLSKKRDVRSVRRAKSLLVQAQRLKEDARLEDLTVRLNPLIKTTKNGEKRVYYRWVASWREGKKIRVVYLGSINKMSKDQALEKAKRLKSQYLEKHPLNGTLRFRLANI